ncbi:putative Ribosomal RNA-processing protein 8 [Seiridium cardinale]|uniref:Ribosomal RNA-processing protein 8 n=1 Tax=Seiridium cardinale TaxID=138064 RepID=A0ABR2X970_9PEZI
MFAVPGWSVSAASLKAESTKDGKGSDKPSDQAGSNKRKRPSGPASNVNSDNVAGLYESVIQGKSKKKPRRDSESRKQKKDKKHGSSNENDAEAASQDVIEDVANGKGSDSVKAELPHPAPNGAATEDKKEKRKKRKRAKDGNPEEQNKQQPASTETEKVIDDNKKALAAAPPAPPKLTPMQAAMREKLISARFRHLNETLYTRPSAEAFSLFEESPEMFQEYHEGFRRQVNVWPENPVDGYIKDIKLRGRQRQLSRDKGKPSHNESSRGPAPLLRTGRTCTIADLGCGDAKLAESLQSEKKKLNLEILSYDLQSPSPLVTRADIANLPLEDGSVNVVIFCLALMGTNWPAFIDEAYRILHWKGELWIAEIKSRFTVPSAKKGKPVMHSVGNRKKNQGGKKGKNDAEEEGATEETLAVVVDGAEEKKQETDVSAFVEALRKRGFLLQGQGQDAVDLSNKMFVKMHFTKAAPALVGKNVVADKEPARGGAKKGPAKFITAGESNTVDESSILKPCVYKLR